MKSEVSKKIVAAALLLALALVSFFPVAQKMSQPQTFSDGGLHRRLRRHHAFAGRRRHPHR